MRDLQNIRNQKRNFHSRVMQCLWGPFAAVLFITKNVPAGGVRGACNSSTREQYAAVARGMHGKGGRQ